MKITQGQSYTGSCLVASCSDAFTKHSWDLVKCLLSRLSLPSPRRYQGLGLWGNGFPSPPTKTLSVRHPPKPSRQILVDRIHDTWCKTIRHRLIFSLVLTFILDVSSSYKSVNKQQCHTRSKLQTFFLKTVFNSIQSDNTSE